MKKSFLLTLSMFLSCCSAGGGNNNNHPVDPNAGYKEYLFALVDQMPLFQSVYGAHQGKLVPYYYCDWGTLEGEYYNKETGWVEIQQVGFNYNHESQLDDNDGTYIYSAYIDYRDRENDYYLYHSTFNESERLQYESDAVEYECYHGATIDELSRLGVNTEEYDFLYFYKYNDEFDEMVEKLKNCYDYLDDRSKLFIEDDYHPAFDEYNIIERISWSFSLKGNDGVISFEISSEPVDSFNFDLPFFTNKIALTNRDVMKLTLRYGNRFYRRFVISDPIIDDFYINATSEESCTQIFAKMVNVTSPYEAEYSVLDKDETKSLINDYNYYVGSLSTYLGPSYYDLTIQADAALLYSDITSSPYMNSTMTISFHYGQDYIRLVNDYIRGDEVEHREFSLTHEENDGVTTYYVHDVLQNPFDEKIEAYDRESTTTNYSEIRGMITSMRMAYVYGSSVEVLAPFFINNGDEMKLENAFALRSNNTSFPKQVNYDLHDYRKGCHYLGEVRFTGDYAHYAEVLTDAGEITLSVRLTPIN